MRVDYCISFYQLQYAYVYNNDKIRTRKANIKSRKSNERELTCLPLTSGQGGCQLGPPIGFVATIESGHIAMIMITVFILTDDGVAREPRIGARSLVYETIGIGKETSRRIDWSRRSLELTIDTARSDTSVLLSTHSHRSRTCGSATRMMMMMGHVDTRSVDHFRSFDLLDDGVDLLSDQSQLQQGQIQAVS